MVWVVNSFSTVLAQMIDISGSHISQHTVAHPAKAPVVNPQAACLFL